MAPQRLLDTHGPAAVAIAELWWFFLVVTAAICVVVAVLLALGLYRARRRTRGEDVPFTNAHVMVWGGGVVMPVIVLFVFLLINYRVGAELRAADRGAAFFTVEVIGHQFWWEVRYPELGITTANEIHIPVGVPIRFLVMSPDVIHSFWVPQLHGKIDMIPGHVNTITLQADRPGSYRGQCAEYCGMAHALMAFWLIAHEPDSFGVWVGRRTQPIAEPDDAAAQRGRALFDAAGCASCHATRGAPLAPALGSPGPDLSDFASRRTIGAGTLPNTRAALARWLTDPESIKPGSRMPPTAFAPQQLADMLAYLETLR